MNNFPEQEQQAEETQTKAVGKPRWYVVQVASGCEKKSQN